VSAVTDAALDEVTAWQNRRLELVCAIVYFDALPTSAMRTQSERIHET